MGDAREIAYDITRRVNSAGGYLGLLLRYGMAAHDLDGRDRSLVSELAYGVQRHRAKLDFIVASFSNRPLADIDPEVLDILRLGVYQLAEMRVPQHAAVNETVKLVRKRLGRSEASFVNALMRSASRGLEGVAWPERENLPLFLETVYSHPRWLVEYLLRLLGPQGAEALCAVDNTIQGMTLRRPVGYSGKGALRSAG
jgi:16S rRNA (cytosine967-C5)-methyltransferase